METKSAIKSLTKKQLQRIEVRNVDYYINSSLIDLKKAMTNEDKAEMERLKDALRDLSVKRHYLDPKGIIPNNY